jgi:hypothetical protein
LQISPYLQKKQEKTFQKLAKYIKSIHNINKNEGKFANYVKRKKKTFIAGESTIDSSIARRQGLQNR